MARSPYDNSTASILDRPLEQKIREHKYRFAQAIVFGLPVLALHFFSARLGGIEAQRWSAALQALLAGWITYIAAAGMIFEGIILLIARRKLTADLVIGVLALALYLCSLAASLARDRPLFLYGVILLAAWGGLRWAQLVHRSIARADL